MLLAAKQHGQFFFFFFVTVAFLSTSSLFSGNAKFHIERHFYQAVDFKM
jgi:hypothetical protein